MEQKLGAPSKAPRRRWWGHQRFEWLIFFLFLNSFLEMVKG